MKIIIRRHPNKYLRSVHVIDISGATFALITNVEDSAARFRMFILRNVRVDDTKLYATKLYPLLSMIVTPQEEQEVDAWWEGVVLSRSLWSEHLKPGSKRGI
jgi:hypothetical protein